LTIPYGPAAEPWDVSQVSPPRRPGVRHTAGIGYLYKRLLLGRPIATARLEHERLGKPTALAVFSSDNMSSVAYATEEILRALIPVVGVAAFALVLPISAAIVLVEAILIFSYRQTIKAYPSAGGAYIVTKDNLGLLPAQLAGVALLIDYVLTVSVSVAAGVEAIRVPPSGSRSDRALAVLHLAHRLRQLTRRSGIGAHLRPAHVRVHREPLPDVRRGAV